MKKPLLLCAILAYCLAPVFGQQTDHQQLEESVEELRNLLISPEQQPLEKITFTHLSYGHSNGKIEDQQEFIDYLLSGKSQFVTIELHDQTVDIVGNTGVVRHNLTAETNNEGETVHIKLGVLLIWQKEGSQWKLLARQAFK